MTASDQQTPSPQTQIPLSFDTWKWSHPIGWLMCSRWFNLSRMTFFAATVYTSTFFTNSPAMPERAPTAPAAQAAHANARTSQRHACHTLKKHPPACRDLRIHASP
jgi:hypothetical protein